MVVSFNKINIIFLLILAILLTGYQLKEKISQSGGLLATVEKNREPLKNNLATNSVANLADNNPDNKKISSDNYFFWHIKDVPLNITDSELDQIKAWGFKVLLPEWGVADTDVKDVENLLDRLAVRDLKIVLDGGFSAGALGFQDDGSDAENQKPVWQKDKITVWLNELKNHPAVYGWDISNEAGENVPNGDRFKISLLDLKNISREVRSLDKTHPILLRMHYWDEDDGDFGLDNPFDKDLVDIVILNLYSNYSEDGATALLPDMIADSGQILINKIRKIDPAVKIWLSLGAFAELPMFLQPTSVQLTIDHNAAAKLNSFESLGFFGWGESDGDWYLPRDGQDIIKTIRKYIK